jgi:ankyrin repeat protein
MENACEAGHLGIVQAIIETGMDVNARVGLFPPIMVAARQGHEDVVDALIAAGADLELASSYTKLVTVAADGNCLRLVKRLVAEEWQDPKQVTEAIWVAAIKGHCEVIKVLIAAGGHVDAVIGRRTSLMMALSNGHSEAARILIAAGADVLAPGHAGLTMLLCAARGGCADMIPLLLEAGHEVNAMDKDGRTALSYASDAATAQLLLDAKADVNPEGESVLYAACALSQADTIRLLLQAGARLDSTTLDTMLSRVITGDGRLMAPVAPDDKVSAAKLLLESGTRRPIAPRTTSLLHKCAARCKDEAMPRIVELLVATDPALLDAEDEEGCTALMIAAKGRHANSLVSLCRDGAKRIPITAEIATTLLKAGADVNKRDLEGRSAIFHACPAPGLPPPPLWRSIVPMLLAAGADLRVQDNEGMTVLSRLMAPCPPDSDYDSDASEEDQYDPMDEERSDLVMMLSSSLDSHSDDMGDSNAQ